MSKYLKKISLFAIMCILIGVMSLPVSAKTSTDYIKVPSNYKNSGVITTIYLSNLKKDAKITLKSYVDSSKYNWKTRRRTYFKKEVKSQMYITMYDKRGRLIWGGEKTVGTKGVDLRLGRDHDVYKITVREVKLPWNKYWTAFWPFTHPDYYSLTCKSNCSIR